MIIPSNTLSRDRVRQTILVYYAILFQKQPIHYNSDNINKISARSTNICQVHHHCPGVPCLIVGTQVDLRDDPAVVEKLAKQKQRVVLPEAGERLARELGAVKYVECSALTQRGVSAFFVFLLLFDTNLLILTLVLSLSFSYNSPSDTLICNIQLKNVFDEAIVAALEPPVQKKKTKCNIL